ncbi:MAG: sigma-70 family RNA polymerase sigma factor, partial [Planctomycetota bacterium]
MSPDRFTVDALMTHEGLVRGLARSILKGDDRSEDVVQETWATALRTSPRDPGALGRWLGTISRRLALRVKRSDESRQRRESAPRGRSAVPTPAEIAEREETRRAVLRALLDLDPLYRDVLLLRFYEDLPPREVAAHLGVPVETARSRIRRGIASLRRTLRSRYGDRQRALPLALVLLAEAPTPAAAFPALLAMKTAAVVLALAGAGTGLVALADP